MLDVIAQLTQEDNRVLSRLLPRIRAELEEQLESPLGPSASTDELAAHLGITPGAARILVRQHNRYQQTGHHNAQSLGRRGAGR